jgi:hypothetical protein
MSTEWVGLWLIGIGALELALVGLGSDAPSHGRRRDVLACGPP